MRAYALFGLLLSLATYGCGGGGGGPAGDSTGFTVSGTILVSGPTVADGDVNDPNAAYAANDTASTAQSLPNPVSVGGYVNEPGTGPAGISQAVGDRSDFYRVSLFAGQFIRLRIGDPEAGDLDLYLYDKDGVLLDGSVGTGSDEFLAVGSDGEYLLEVDANAGFSKYLLNIGLTSAPAAPWLRLSDDFVPGDIIVRFADDPLPGSEGVKSRAQSLGLSAKAGGSGRAMLMSLGDEEGRNMALQRLGIGSSDRLAARAPSGVDKETGEKWDTIQAIKVLAKRADIVYAEPNYRRRVFAIPNDAYFGFQWNYPLINLPEAWELTTGSDGEVTVAVIDTGVLLNHPDLEGRLTFGYDFILDPDTALDGDGIDDNPDDPGDRGGFWGESSFHGTHVAGTVGATSDNGQGVAGVTWSGKIRPIRVLGHNGGTSYDVAQGVLYAAGLPNDSGTIPPRRADVINLSFGGGGFSQFSQDVYSQARETGAILIAAAGNDATNTPEYPASYEGVVSVSAVDMVKTLAPYSNFGRFVDLAAPGGDVNWDLNGDGYVDGVLSTAGDDSSGQIQYLYSFIQGTSMASPHVAGVAALMKVVNPGLTPDAFDSLLQAGGITEDLGSPGLDDYFGHGLIDAYAAVSEAKRVGDLEPPLVATPVSLDFDQGTDSATFVVDNGGGSLAVESLSVDRTWLSVAPECIDADGLGTYRVTVDRTGLCDDIFTASITLTSSENPLTVPVTMQVSTAESTADAGSQYVMLVDPETGDVLGQVRVGPANGSYSYRFTGVRADAYEIWAGSDVDNDGNICGAGEACGVYGTGAAPVTVTVDRDLHGLDFHTSIVSARPSQGVSAVSCPVQKSKSTPLQRRR